MLVGPWSRLYIVGITSVGDPSGRVTQLSFTPDTIDARVQKFHTCRSATVAPADSSVGKWNGRVAQM